MRLLFYSLLFLSTFEENLSLPDGLHPTPPMGWSSWNTFFGPGSEGQIIAQVKNNSGADLLHRSTKIHAIDDVT